MRYSDIESKIQSEIRRRVIERSTLVQQEKDTLLDTQYTLEALHELTGLPFSEIEKIAMEVRESFPLDKEDVFSIRNQVLAVALLGLLIILLLGLTLWIL
ncbi:MAG: hypothetical protein ACYS0I_19085 [Planctomycetota bacterium]|jgi:hypothetical protein